LDLKDLYFDCIQGFVIDPMHGVFMGVTKKITTLWLDPKFKTSEWNVSSLIKDVDFKFSRIKVPHDFGRKPRNLEKNRKSFKGNGPSIFKTFTIIFNCFGSSMIKYDRFGSVSLTFCLVSPS